MPTRDEQQKIREGEVVGQPRRERMAFEVVDGDQRLSKRQGKGLAGRQAHHDAADEPGPRRGRDAVEVLEVHPGPSQSTFDQPIDDLDMSARRDLRYDTAKGRMVGDLAHDLVREDVATTLVAQPHHAGGAFVARRLDAQNAHCTLPPDRPKVPDVLPSDKAPRAAGGMASALPRPSL